jgi:hypothetical protein
MGLLTRRKLGFQDSNEYTLIIPPTDERGQLINPPTGGNGGVIMRRIRRGNQPAETKGRLVAETEGRLDGGNGGSVMVNSVQVTSKSHHQRMGGKAESPLSGFSIPAWRDLTDDQRRRLCPDQAKKEKAEAAYNNWLGRKRKYRDPFPTLDDAMIEAGADVADAIRVKPTKVMRCGGYPDPIDVDLEEVWNGENRYKVYGSHQNGLPLVMDYKD